METSSRRHFYGKRVFGQVDYFWIAVNREQSRSLPTSGLPITNPDKRGQISAIEHLTFT
jgi:hypothetical protein